MKNSLALSAQAVFIGVLALIGNQAQAQTTFIKADNTTSLNLAASYTSNSTVPTSADTIQIDGTLTQSRTSSLGGNLSINALSQTTAANNQFQISNTANATLTIGAGGITKASSTTNGTIILNSSVTLGANQTWAITGGGTNNTLQMNGAFNDNGKTLAVTGNGTFDLRGSNTFGSNVTIDTTVSVNTAAGIVTLGGNNTMNVLSIPAGRVRVGSIGNYGVASNAGDGGTNSTITLGGNGFNGTFEYTGSSASTNRTFTRDMRSAASGIEVSTAGQTLTITSNLLYAGTPTTTSNWVFGGSGNITLSGNISTGNATFAQGVTKNGSGTLTFGAANTYAGVTTVNAGTLLLSSTGTVANTTGVTIVGGAVELGASERINNSANLTMSGGTFKTGGFSETLGLLTLTANSTLDFGSGTSTVLFSGIAAGATGIFAITNWNFGSDSLRFTSNTNLSAANFTVNGGEAAVLNQGAYYEVVPEPTTWALLAMGLTTLVVFRRWRQAKA